MPKPARWTDDDTAASAGHSGGRSPQLSSAERVAATVHAIPWWQRSAAQHPATRFLLIFAVLAGLWFGWKYIDTGPTGTPTPPATVAAPQPPAVDTPVLPPPIPIWADAPDVHMSDEARRAALLDKEAAWRAWYQRPERCEHPATREIEVECATHYLEHAREFEARYRAGTMPTSGAEQAPDRAR